MVLFSRIRIKRKMLIVEEGVGETLGKLVSGDKG